MFKNSKGYKSALVTGSQGFIGSRMIEKLLNLGWSVKGVDLEDYPEGIAHIRDLDCVFHLGAISDTLNQNVNQMMQANVLATMEIIQEAKNQGKPMVFASSASVFGSCNEPENLYAWTKFIGQEYGRSHFPEKFTALQYFNVYGPGESHKGKMASVAFQAWEKGYFYLFSGKPKRDFVYIDDVIKANLMALDQAPGVYQVGTGTAEPFEKILDILEIPYQYADPKKLPQGYQFHTQAYSSQFIPGWKPSYPLEEGLKEYRTYLESVKLGQT